MLQGCCDYWSICLNISKSFLLLLPLSFSFYCCIESCLQICYLFINIFHVSNCTIDLCVNVSCFFRFSIQLLLVGLDLILSIFYLIIYIWDRLFLFTYFLIRIPWWIFVFLHWLDQCPQLDFLFCHILSGIFERVLHIS